MNNIQNENNAENDIIEEVKPFTMRKWFICMMIPTMVMLILTLFVLKGSMYSEKESVVNYNETGDIDYKVYLKDNSFYNDKYLGKDMQYVASLIDKININYKFNMKSDNNLNYDYKYNIKADLLITDWSSIGYEYAYTTKKPVIFINTPMKMALIQKLADVGRVKLALPITQSTPQPQSAITAEQDI